MDLTVLLISGIIYGLIFGIICSVMAYYEKRFIIGWFLIGFFFGIIGIIALLVVSTIRKGKQERENTKESETQNSKKPLLLVGLAFVGLVFFVFLTNQKVPVSWVENYEDALKLAKNNNKPLLLVFYKPGAPMYVEAVNKTYNDPKVKKFVENNFVPVLINCDKEAELALKFNIGYYPTHYVKHPEYEELFGPRLGMDPPPLFIEKIQELLDEMNESIK